MNEKQRKLIELLKEMFQLNQTDLDFGIYRIMNQKADEINEFLEKDLIKSIKAAFSSNSNDSLQKELDELCTNITNAGMNPDDSPKVKELKEKIASASNSENDENEIYSYLTNFFSRYYKDGDFVSLRRYKKDTYAVPYEGEEVKLHWANSDQYYIKTSEFFRDYTFTVKDKKFHFKLVDADTEKNNNKAGSDKERRFVLDEETPIFEENGEVFIRFEYKPIGKTAQNKLNEEALEVLAKLDNELLEPLKELAPTEKNKNRTILEKHLTDYTSRNSFDYFIHKDLNGFLSRELDFFIKNEILYIDDILESSTSKIESSLNKVKTFKTIANKVIAFLSQLEDFQKKLWLKKKFVIDTNYCITLDKIDESFYQEIFDNKEQLKEWKELFKVDIKSVEDLKEERFLVLDTKFFDAKFKNKLLSEFDDIDEECDGVLINSENFGALNLLQDRYKEQVKTVYIDPPYNTGNDGFLYKDNYGHSSWLSFMYDRMRYTRELISKDGVFFSQCDYNEQSNLKALNDIVFNYNFINEIIWKRKFGNANETRRLGTAFDNIYFYGKTKEYSLNLICEKNSNHVKEYIKKRFTRKDNEGIHKGKLWMPYPLANPGKPTANLLYEYKGYKPPEKGWRMIKEKLEKLDNEGRIYFPEDINQRLQEKKFLDEYDGQPVDALWTDIFVINSQSSEAFDFDGQKPEDLMNRIIKIGSNEKDIILDYFSGTGTTLAVSYKTNRKFIAVEMGEHFNQLTLKRAKSVITGKTAGIKSLRQGGMFKYFKLESYEDSLNNLAFKNVNKNLFDHDVKEDYLLNYMLDYETNESLLNIDAFKTPFDYKLKIASSSAGETVETNVDLIETFNYLIGLKVKTREENKGFLVIQGQNLKEEKILIIWRNGQSNDDLNSFFEKMDWTVYDREFDTIYVNGDNNLANLKKDEDHFKVKLIEEEFKLRMFGE